MHLQGALHFSYSRLIRFDALHFSYSRLIRFDALHLGYDRLKTPKNLANKNICAIIKTAKTRRACCYVVFFFVSDLSGKFCRLACEVGSDANRGVVNHHQLITSIPCRGTLSDLPVSKPALSPVEVGTA